MAANKKTSKPKRKRSKLALLRNIIVMVVLTFTLRYAVTLFVLGMLPYFVATYADQSNERNASKVVFACNFAGVLPYIVQVWTQGISPENVQAMLGNMYVWLVMYSAAGFGWLLVWSLPKIVHFTLDSIQNSNVHSLRKKQQTIVSEWGMQVEAVSRRALRNAAIIEENAAKAADS